MSSHDDEPDRSTGSVTGDEDDHRNEETEDQSVQEQQEMTDEPKVSLEDGELEDGELDDDDDNDGSGGGGGGGGNNGATLDNAGNSEPISENASEAQSHLTGVASVEKSGNSSTTDLSQPKKKEIPSLFDLKTTKPKSLKRLADIQGNKSYVQYVDHDRMDEDYYNDEGDEMAGNAWPRYPIPNDDYESSECDQEEPEDEFSAQIQQMLNRSAAASHGPGDKSPRGPYDSPSEDEDDDDAERPPPAKMPRVDYDDGDGDDDDGGTSYGDVTKGNRKMKKLLVATNGRMNDNGDDSYQKKSKMILSRSNKHGELSGGALEALLPEKRRLMDTPMEERPQCKFFLEAKCKKGSNCPFNHDLPRPKKQDICRYFISGRQCGMGKDCPFSHDVRGISGEENDCKPDNMMSKKKKALLGSPPLQSRMMQSKDKRKIPSLFDIQINAEGPNTKEILQSAARRSVMQTSNPKPGLLGVAPPMVAAGMLGSMNRMRFPPMGQGFFDGFNRPHLPPKLESQSHLHSKMEEHGMDNMAYGPQNPNPDFMPPSETKENGLLQNVNYLNQNVDFLGRMDGQAVEEMPKNVSSDFAALPNFPGLTAAVSAAMALPPPHFTTPNSIPVQSQPNLSIPGNLNDQSTLIQSLIPPPDLPSFAPQFTSLPPSQSAVNEVADLQRSATSPLSNAGDVDKPQVVGGVDVNHLPPKQRELYLRIFAQQKETSLLPPDQISSDRPREQSKENLAMQPAASAITASSDLLKFLVPSQVSSQSSLTNSLVSAQPSSNSSFNITQMLSAICAEGIPNINQLSTGTGLISAENQRQLDVVLEVSGTSLRGPYKLEPVTLDTNTITLPSFVDPKDSKYSSDPRVQKHKDDVVVAAVVHKDDNSKQPLIVAQTDVPLRTQRRDPRLARKETAAGKEEAVHLNQDTQPRLSAQQGAAGTAMALGGTSLGAPGLSGALSLGNIPPPGMPMGGMNHSGLPLSSLPIDIVPQQNGMNMGGLQHSGLMVGNMQLGGIPGGIHIGSSQPAGITGAGGSGMNANVPMAGMQHGGIGGMIIGGLQQGNRAPSGIQSLMSVGMQMAGMQGNPPIGTMQQCGPNLGNIGQGGMPFGGMHQGGLQPGNLPLGGAPSQQSILPLAAGIAMSAMQQQMGIAMGSGAQQQGGLLPQLSGGLLQQRSLLPPPFLPQNQMSPMNAFQHVSNLIRAQMPFNTCPPTMFSAEMAQHESSGASGLAAGSVGPNVSFQNTLQSNPSIPRPLLPMQLPPANVQMLGQSCSEPLVQLSSSPSLQTSQNDTGIQNEPVVGTIQPLPEISGSVELPVASEMNLDDTFVSSENSAVKTNRTVGYQDETRFKIKKARNADDTTENSIMSDDSPAPASPLASELDVESRRALLRNRDKLEFRSPLADMGDSAGSSQSSGYNQPPNRKYQQMAEEENSSRRSPAPSKPTKAGFKARQRTVGRQAQNKQVAVAPVFENLRTSHDVTAEDVIPSVQSVKDMFKSIDPTASPFC